MSITFWAPEAPTIQVTPYPEDEPEFQETRSTLPELNVSNGNAGAVLQMLELEFDYSGTISVDQMAAMMPALLVCANSASERRPLQRPVVDSQRTTAVRDGNVTTITRGARDIDCGLSDTQLKRYAQTLLELFTACRQRNFDVSWG